MHSAELLRRARVIADYQFGRGAGRALFGDDVVIELSSTSRIRQIKEGTLRIATLRARDGLFTLSPLGGERLRRHFAPPAHRVVVDGEAAPFVRQGKTAFAKFVLSCSPLIRAGDEVLVVDEDDVLLATGRAVLSAREMLDARVGAAVDVRYGVEDWP